MRKKVLLAFVLGMSLITSKQAGAESLQNATTVQSSLLQDETEDTAVDGVITQPVMDAGEQSENLNEQAEIEEEEKTTQNPKEQLKSIGKELVENNIANVSILLILIIALGIVTKKNTKLKEENIQ